MAICTPLYGKGGTTISVAGLATFLNFPVFRLFTHLVFSGSRDILKKSVPQLRGHRTSQCNLTHNRNTLTWNTLKMRLPQALGFAVLAGNAAADVVKDLEDEGRPALDAVIAQSETCSEDKLEVRREW